MKILKDSANFQYMHYFFATNVAYIKYAHYICIKKFKCAKVIIVLIFNNRDYERKTFLYDK